MSASIFQSLDHFLAIGGLFTGAIGISFFFAGMKIKGEISLEVAKQISEISIGQIKAQFEDSRLAQLLLDLKAEIDVNKAELAQQRQEAEQLRQEIEQLQGFLVAKGYSRRRRSGGEEQP